VVHESGLSLIYHLVNSLGNNPNFLIPNQIQIAVILWLMIHKILIANRGEIAVRIIRACKEMGIATVAMYSDADRLAPHILKADEAYYAGPSPSSESYLNTSRIFEIIQQSSADAVHPGYGFLSENTGFSDEIIRMGVTWIGPSAESITTMGDKMAARKLAMEVNAPIIPGTTQSITDPEKAKKLAAEIGYPILIKAAGGGGGKGMRIVNDEKEIISAMERASSEAGKAFSDDRIYIEKYLEEPHHIEVQVFADQFGNIVTFGERECSVQRRYQKIIEESPSPFITDDLRQQLQKTAYDITKKCKYLGAGTIEFLVDKHRKFYFLEMNTRLQVEHPVTEMIYGVDLVKEQLHVASGKPLSFSQIDLQPNGHAIECRIYAEDGYQNFAPSIGFIKEMETPNGPGIRLDEGVREGQEISPYYDPLLGKLIAWGADREESMHRMIRALGEFRVVGIDTTIPFCREFIAHSTFRKGQYCTHTLDEIISDLKEKMHISKTGDLIAGSIGAIIHSSKKVVKPLKKDQIISKWTTAGRMESLR
jgi:acetyl-CoA carboxylase, biotin carboxylase subunit